MTSLPAKISLPAVADDPTAVVGGEAKVPAVAAAEEPPRVEAEKPRDPRLMDFETARKKIIQQRRKAFVLMFRFSVVDSADTDYGWQAYTSLRVSAKQLLEVLEDVRRYYEKRGGLVSLDIREHIVFLG